MEITNDDVQKIAKLARLHVGDQQSDAVATQLTQIVDMMDQLGAVDTDGVEPLVHAVEVRNVLAVDQTRESLDREDALSNATNSDEECFRVPNVL